ncbi:RNA polymerase sigma-70 factor, ECF subfamily [Caenispirillum bisanense]|uniref:RNA polymerase sigma-70 factor, ECF subfamily n=2 Tax=Caenispirillum bisanense TaxID=414052 RepID=A0A286GL80_9PROT|nr:RNA polymerase sigma-70 factor, ECF subfamily [Caenispirillum bisanense]
MRAWLFTILRNTLYNETKRARRQVEQTEEPVSAVSGGQEEALAMRDVQRAFDSLPEIQKEVVLLVAVEGMEYEDAAAVLGVPVGTVKSRLSRARQDIRAFLDTAKPKSGG